MIFWQQENCNNTIIFLLNGFVDKNMLSEERIKAASSSKQVANCHGHHAKIDYI